MVACVYSPWQEERTTVAANIESKNQTHDIEALGKTTAVKAHALGYRSAHRIYGKSVRIPSPKGSYFKMVKPKPNFKFKRRVEYNGKSKYSKLFVPSMEDCNEFDNPDQEMYNEMYYTDPDEINNFYYNNDEQSEYDRTTDLSNLLNDIGILINKFESVAQRIKSSKEKYNKRVESERKIF